MAFADTETSRFDAQPVELYHFDGTNDDWYLTSSADTITSNGNDYLPIAGLKRSVLKVGTQAEDQLALDIELPFDHPLAVAYAFQSAPPSLTMNLYRAHRDNPSDVALLWKGRVLSFSVSGRTCKMRVPPVFSYLLQGTAPAPRYQAPCNHVLFDARCGVSPTAHQHVATVTAIANNIITLDSLGTITGAELIAGDMIWAAGGENRMMISAAGTDVTVTYPFAGLTVGQSVTIRKGCDHSFATCKSKFANGASYGGCPLVPDRNPFMSTP